MSDKPVHWERPERYLAGAMAPVFAALDPALGAVSLADGDPAARLPPIFAGGVECRLGGADSRTVDLQMCLRRNDRPAACMTGALREALRQMLPDAPVWHRLDELLADWRDTTQLDEIWLEFDAAPCGWQPSVFLGLSQTVEEPARRFDAVIMLIHRLMGADQTAGIRDSLRLCLESAPDGMFLSHIGLMLGRVAGGLRINLKRLQADTLPVYLKAVGWPGDLAAVQPLLEPLFAVSDRITLALDLAADGMTPALGLECMAARGSVSGWADLLDLLSAWGLCAPDRRQAMLAWPRRLTPGLMPWPAELIRADLTDAASGPAGIDLRISHVKLARDAAGRVTAKGYLWYGYEPGGRAVAKPQKSEQGPAPAAWDGRDGTSDIRIRTRRYFETMTRHYLEELGTTFRAYMLGTDGDVARSNQNWAHRAGLCRGMRVLDAGCGVGGPAIDIASAFDLQIDGITLCPQQAGIGRDLVMSAGLADRVRITLGDYHHLPWPDQHFDAVYFFESSNHTDDPAALFAEMYRVLRPGGILYVSDCFVADDAVRDPEIQAGIVAFDSINADRTRTLTATADAFRHAGLEGVTTANLSGLVSLKRWIGAYHRQKNASLRLTALGQLYAASSDDVVQSSGRGVIFCGEVRGVKGGR